MKHYQKFFNLPTKDKALAIEAFFLLAWYRVTILVMPFRVIAARLEKASHRSQVPEASRDKRLPGRIGRAVSSVAAHTPWDSKCLVQSLTAYRMLKQRQYPCDLYLGVAKDDQGKMVAHAWTQSGAIDVTGTAIREQYTVTYHFQ
jgi:hypothetical protein